MKKQLRRPSPADKPGTFHGFQMFMLTPSARRIIRMHAVVHLVELQVYATKK